MSQIKAMQVSINERPYLIGKSELMGYLGIKSLDTLHNNYLSKGLRCKLIGRQQYYYKSDIDRFILEHDENPIR